MSAFKKLFYRESHSKSFRRLKDAPESVSNDPSANSIEHKDYIDRLESENIKLKKQLSTSIVESKTISFQLGKVLIDVLNRDSSGKKLPAELLKIYVESRKRKVQYLHNANFLDKLVILFNDEKLLKEYKLTENKSLRYKEIVTAENKKSFLNNKLNDTSKEISNIDIPINKSSNKKTILLTNEVGTLDIKKPLIPSNELDHIISNNEPILVLKNEPVWTKVVLKEGNVCTIKGGLTYKNIIGAGKPKAVLLIKCFDETDKELDVVCGKMTKSSAFGANFRYLPNTQGIIKTLHTFEVPQGVKSIVVGICGFNADAKEEVLVKSFNISVSNTNLVKLEPTGFNAKAAAISVIGWPDYPLNNKPYIMGIMDEFTAGSFENDVNLIQPRPDNWYALAEKYRPVMIFIESAWKGNYGSWQYRVAEYANKPGHEVAQLCQYAQEKGIPTVFWNKEDPVHHNKFMCSAKLVNHIFTTDANMIKSYEQKTGNKNVYALPFAAQPVLHKPAALVDRKPVCCFAGSWYGTRHEERGEAMKWLLQAANKYGLEIYDRNFRTGNFVFPEEFSRGIKGSLPYKDLCNEYSRYRVFLNVNSVTESPTMFSRRVFELMAAGTPVVSTYAKGIENLFNSDAVWIVYNKKEAEEAIHTLLTDDVEWRRRSLAGIREVFAKHTYAHRLNYIFEKLGSADRLSTNPAILLIASASSEKELILLNEIAKLQVYDEFQLGIEYSKEINSTNILLSEKVVLLKPGQRKDWILGLQDNYSITGWISFSSCYGAHYLRDLANASIYEPTAMGWAKAINGDMFAFGAIANLSGAIWKTSEFLKQYINAQCDALITQPKLYIADSNEFQGNHFAEK